MARAGSFRKSDTNAPRERSKVQIFVQGLPLNAKLTDIVGYFSTVGRIKLDRETRKPRVWIYHDKQTGAPTGEATITYNDRETQAKALQAYDKQNFGNSFIEVSPAYVKAHMADPPILPPRPPRGRGGFRGGSRGPPRGRGGSSRGSYGGGNGGYSNYSGSNYGSQGSNYGRSYGGGRY